MAASLVACLPRVVLIYGPGGAAVIFLVIDVPKRIVLARLLAALVCGVGVAGRGGLSVRIGCAVCSPVSLPWSAVAQCEAASRPAPEGKLPSTCTCLLQPGPQERPRRHDWQVIKLQEGKNMRRTGVGRVGCL